VLELPSEDDEDNRDEDSRIDVEMLSSIDVLVYIISVEILKLPAGTVRDWDGPKNNITEDVKEVEKVAVLVK